MVGRSSLAGGTSGQAVTRLSSLLLAWQGTNIAEYRRFEVPYRRRTERRVFVSRVEVTSDGIRLRDRGRRLELGSDRGCSSVMVPFSVAVPGGGGGWSGVKSESESETHL